MGDGNKSIGVWHIQNQYLLFLREPPLLKYFFLKLKTYLSGIRRFLSLKKSYFDLYPVNFIKCFFRYLAANYDAYFIIINL